MKDVWQRIKECNCPVVLYGTGNGADQVLNRLCELNIPVAGIFASSGFIRERTFRSYKVESFEELYRRFPDMLILLCFGSSRPEVRENVLKLSSCCSLLVPEVPVYGETVFTKEFYEKNKEKLQTVYKHLADEPSKSCFESIIRFRLTGELSYLLHCEVSENHVDSLIPMKENAVIADLGAYNGDTALRFNKLFPNIKQLIAIEPDRRNYKKLVQNTKDIKNIKCLNALAGKSVGSGFLAPSSGRGVHIESSGKQEIPMVCMDDLFREERVDFIKMDVEGEEAAVIGGSEQTIKKYRPILMISCYHRSEDLFSIPLQVLSYYSDYRVFLRHTPALNSWNSEYLFIPKE